MTDQMSVDQFDREIRGFLTWQADDIAGAPSATEMATRISAREGTRMTGLRLTPQLAWILLLVLLTAALVGAAIVGASLLRQDPLRFGGDPQNGWIAVSANPVGVLGGEAGDIYLISNDAPARRIIGSNFDSVAQACPALSPDGRRLAYGESTASEQPVDTFRGVWPVPNRAVVVVEINEAGDASSPIMRVPISTERGEIACPKWSPDGKYVAFRHGFALWIADPENGDSSTVRLTEAPWGQQGFAWSHDGSRIAVAERGQIRIVPINAEQSTVIPVSGATPGQLGWTAKDDRIVYTVTDEPGDGQAIHFVDVDGENDTRLTPDSTDLQLTFSYSIVSPDGTQVAYLQRIYRCDVEGCTQDPEHLLISHVDHVASVLDVPIPSGFSVSGLQWSPDGKRLLIGSIDGLVSIPAAPDSSPVVHSQGELNLEWSPSEFTWQPVYR